MTIEMMKQLKIAADKCSLISDSDGARIATIVGNSVAFGLAKDITPQGVFVAVKGDSQSDQLLREIQAQEPESNWHLLPFSEVEPELMASILAPWESSAP